MTALASPALRIAGVTRAWVGNADAHRHAKHPLGGFDGKSQTGLRGARPDDRTDPRRPGQLSTFRPPLRQVGLSPGSGGAAYSGLAVSGLTWSGAVIAPGI
ncbi:hypothetical protein AL036_14455 [Salipiger aestuarii]|nr:hypothetical protein AL036_14455 [Salipiger aestuarii]KAB2541068.1 hypothetical protein AL035_14355 [Salipiger aestuarii]